MCWKLSAQRSSTENWLNLHEVSPSRWLDLLSLEGIQGRGQCYLAWFLLEEWELIKLDNCACLLPVLTVASVFTSHRALTQSRSLQHHGEINEFLYIIFHLRYFVTTKQKWTVTIL